MFIAQAISCDITYNHHLWLLYFLGAGHWNFELTLNHPIFTLDINRVNEQAREIRNV